jgi:Protein of unknown function (DUF2795)
MSMINARDGSSGLGSFSFWGNRSRISWGAVLAGAVVAAATWLLLSLLGAAFGLGAVSDLQSARGVAAGAGIWTMICLALSMALGGYVASRLSGTHSHLDGELHGITMWAAAIILGVWTLAHAVGGLIPTVSFDIGAAASRPEAASGPFTAGTNSQAAIERFAQSLGNSGDPTTMSREQIASEINSLVGENLLRTGSVPEADRGRLASLVAAQYGLTKDEAGQRVARMESDAKTRLAEAEQRARAVADEVAQDTSAAARALFTALVLGLLGALVGAWLGTRHKRLLHPEEAHASVAAPAYGHAVTEPVSVSVYDDAGHVVAQYLRGVAFPVSKQDLLRFARTSNAGPALLHSIEGLADRNYATANDVLMALGIH